MDLHKIISLVPGIVYQFRLRPDGSSCVPYASEAIREIYRLDPEEIREDASKAFIHVHPDDLEGHLASIQASARDLKPWQNEYRLKFDDGTIRWLYGNALPQREADGSTLWHGFITDISERKNSEENLRQSKEKLRAYLDNISDTIWLIDAGMNMAYVSPSVTRLLGVLPEELVGRPSTLVIHPDDMGVIDNAMSYVMEHPGEPHTIQYRVGHKDGRWIDVESTGVNMLGNPVINGVLVTMRDITERKLMEVNLQASEASMRAILDNSPYLVWLKDPEGHYITANMAHINYARLKDHREITGKTDFDLWPKELAEKYRADDAEVIATRRQKHIEEPSFDGGRMHWVETFKTPVIDKNGKVLGTAGFACDITERKQAEQALAESESRFREIFNTVSDAIFIHDAETGRVLDVNRRMLEMYGLTHEQALACGVNDLSAGTPPYSAAEAFEKIRLACTGSQQTFDWLARARDGHLFWVEVSLRFAFIGSQQRVLAVVRDISERKQTEEALRESEFRWKFALEGSGDGLWDWNVADNTVFFSKRWKEMLGFAEDEISNNLDEWERRIHPDDKAETLATVHAYLDGKIPTYHSEHRVRCKDGSWKWVLDRGMVVSRSEDGKPLRMIGSHADISGRKQIEVELRVAATAFESQDGMLITDANSVILRVNHAFTEITGYTAEDAVGQTPRLLSSGRHDAAFYAAMWESIRQTGSWHGEIWNRRKNGEVYPEQLTITSVKGEAGETSHYVATLRDISRRKAAEEEIYNLAFYDVLTKLPNRRLLDDRLRQAMAASKRSGLYGALMFLDLDNFKPLNDTHGHDMGDLLLAEAARRIASCVRKVDTVARFGGDEFVVMLSELDADKAGSIAQTSVVAEKIRAILSEPYMLTRERGDDAAITVEHRCTSSIGIVLFINHEASAEDILKWADTAMYQAKERGRDQVYFFDSKS